MCQERETLEREIPGGMDLIGSGGMKKTAGPAQGTCRQRVISL